MRFPIIALLLMVPVMVPAQLLYEFTGNSSSRVSSFENPNGTKGQGGKTNRTAKGNAFEILYPGTTKVLLDIRQSGIIQRIWLTVDQNPVLLRSLRLQLFWDGAEKPAVDVPLGDFFGSNLGRRVGYQSALFSTAEGRSFNCYVPMPFRKGAKVVIINESPDAHPKLFYDIDFVLTANLPRQLLYFHTCWQRQKTKIPGEDLVLLPKIKGKGRFLGISAALNVDPVYGKTWWGEGEVKMYIDGDSLYPTINGTGSEDYLGSGWGLGTFSHFYQGCTVADAENGQYDFYRWHIPDAIYFDRDIRVVMQQIGGGDMETVKSLQQKGVPLVPVSIDDDRRFYRLRDIRDSTLDTYSKGWVNFYRRDDYAITTYFYLDKPSSELPSLAPVEERIQSVKR